jgi:hypothetical protein
MAPPSPGRTQACRTAASTILASLLWGLGVPAFAAAIDYFDTYRYTLEIDKDAKLCRHMQDVYAKAFRQPWNYERPKHEIPRFGYVVPDSRLEHDLFFSRYPTTPEFERIPWKQGRGYFENNQKNARPILIAQFDIDNDGVEDLVIKHGFMLAVCGGGGSCPGGEDHIAVLRPGAVDLNKPVDRGLVIKQYLGTSPKGSSLHYDTLRYQQGEAPKGSKAGYRMSARIIRPFIF